MWKKVWISIYDMDWGWHSINKEVLLGKGDPWILSQVLLSSERSRNRPEWHLLWNPVVLVCTDLQWWELPNDMWDEYITQREKQWEDSHADGFERWTEAIKLATQISGQTCFVTEQVEADAFCGFFLCVRETEISPRGHFRFLLLVSLARK